MGCQTVQINLNENWEDQLAEEDLLEAIQKQKDKSNSFPKVNPKRNIAVDRINLMNLCDRSSLKKKFWK